ncbi:hypothetical protein PSE_5017 [Pseudovibrio sp. FO-BEG1]|uniref:DUF2788 domain-containing protein n=1 Tax=Pseudovibrio brasiliensis TaxID=1898042 RepID=A0ABX8AL52_9HYPH|nr:MULTISPECIES: hypothetical protein [Pseudovibrio]AEV39519.1 hypothetical protein PSE_5017 [Pseudovibrio sp. FO-BEG1]QUS55515.1 hypothetical protein KGB56_19690 [Pseudovibrio brasiliensis]
MGQLSNFFSDIPSWVGVILLVVFVLSGRLFRDAWKGQTGRWKLKCWVFGLLALVSFCLMVFGVFDFGWANR